MLSSSDSREELLTNLSTFIHFSKELKSLKYLCSVYVFIFIACSREAERAIRELNDMPPFFLRVQFARSVVEKERVRKERENDEMLRRVLDSEPYPVHSERTLASFNR